MSGGLAAGGRMPAAARPAGHRRKRAHVQTPTGHQEGGVGSRGDPMDDGDNSNAREEEAMDVDEGEGEEHNEDCEDEEEEEVPHTPHLLHRAL